MAGSGTVHVLVGLGLSFLYGLTYLAAGRHAWLTYAGWLVFFLRPASWAA